MQIYSTRDVGRLWLISGVIFAASVAVVQLLGRRDEVRTASLWIGYVGLAAVGAALLLTSHWMNRSGPRSLAIRIGLRIGISVAFLLWALAVVFPFL
jgi:hypothetical protein